MIGVATISNHRGVDETFDVTSSEDDIKQCVA